MPVAWPLHTPEREGESASGAPPTDTGPTGLDNGGSGAGGGVCARFEPRVSRARGFECGMLDVVSGPTAPCRASTCAVSAVSWRDIRFNSVCCVAEPSLSNTKDVAFCCCVDWISRCDDWISRSAALTMGSGCGGGAGLGGGGAAATRAGAGAGGGVLLNPGKAMRSNFGSDRRSNFGRETEIEQGEAIGIGEEVRGGRANDGQRRQRHHGHRHAARRPLQHRLGLIVLRCFVQRLGHLRSQRPSGCNAPTIKSAKQKAVAWTIPATTRAR